jgi:hypothetical protein
VLFELYRPANLLHLLDYHRLLSPSEMIGSPQQKHDHDDDQPDGQRTTEERDHPEHESDVGKLKE